MNKIFINKTFIQLMFWVVLCLGTTYLWRAGFVKILRIISGIE